MSDLRKLEQLTDSELNLVAAVLTNAASSALNDSTTKGQSGLLQAHECVKRHIVKIELLLGQVNEEFNFRDLKGGHGAVR